MEDKTSSKLKSMLDSKKIRNIIIVVGLIGIGLIFLSNWVDFGSLTSGKGDEAFSVKTYSTKIENDLHTYTIKYRDGRYPDESYSQSATGLTSEQYTELKRKMLRSIYINGGFYIGKYETGTETPRTSGSSSTAPKETPVIKPNASKLLGTIKAAACCINS